MRMRSLAIMTRLRSNRSSSTPASGPASMAGTARDSMTPLTTRPRSRGGHRQAEHGDVVEVVADFAHHLADPRVAVVAVLAQQRDECVQPIRSSRTVIARMKSRSSA